MNLRAKLTSATLATLVAAGIGQAQEPNDQANPKASLETNELQISVREPEPVRSEAFLTLVQEATQPPNPFEPRVPRVPRQRPLRSGDIAPDSIGFFAEMRDEELGVPIRPINQLPGPTDPNDLHNHVAHGTASLRTYRVQPWWNTRGLRAAQAATDNPAAAQAQAAEAASATTIDIGFQLRPGISYDTGTAAPGIFNPGLVALNGSAAAHNNGQIFFNGDQTGANTFVLPYRPQVGLNLADDNVGSAAFNLDTISYTGDDLQMRTAAVRLVDTEAEWAIGFGKMETLFGDLGASATSLISGSLPVGTITNSMGGSFDGIKQLRLSHYWHNYLCERDLLELAFSVEDPRALSGAVVNTIGSDPADPTKTTLLNRYPVFGARLRYGSGRNNWDSFQLAGLAIPLGFETNADFSEHFETGYGISSNFRFELGDNNLNDTVYAGFAWGRGIGGYLFGAVPGGTITRIDPMNPALGADINLVKATGAYAAMRHVWCICEDGSSWSSNLMGGLLQAGNSLAGQNRQVYQAGCNLLWNRDKTSLGLEYQYGSRLVQTPVANSEDHGDDHRIMLVLQIDPSTTLITKSGARTPATAKARSGGKAAIITDSVDESTTFTTGSDRASRLRF